MNSKTEKIPVKMTLPRPKSLMHRTARRNNKDCSHPTASFRVENDNWYCDSCSRGMGDDFYCANAWRLLDSPPSNYISPTSEVKIEKAVRFYERQKVIVNSTSSQIG